MTDLGEGRDEAGDADQAGVGEELGHLGDAPDVLLAVLGSEAQVLVQTVPDVVPVQRVAGNAVRHQILLKSKAHGGFTGTGEA